MQRHIVFLQFRQVPVRKGQRIQVLDKLAGLRPDCFALFAESYPFYSGQFFLRQQGIEQFRHRDFAFVKHDHVRSRIERFTVGRSPHVDKKAHETFEQRTHKRLIDIMEPTAKTVDELKKLNLPAGVDITIKI